MSFNQFNKFVVSVYGSGFRDGREEFHETMGDYEAYTEEELYMALRGVKGVGERLARAIVERLTKGEGHENLS